MKFLVDVNASGAVARWLLEMGHDVEQVAAKDPRMRDEEILNWALREGRIIVTTDQDFEAMIWRQGKTHCGVLRLENLPRAERKALLEDVLARHSQLLESGAIVIASSLKIRIRKSVGR
jgi:predicted nuclease of predicted toxin-antitoxin system